MARKTETKLHGDARKVILRGVNAISDPVRVTLGPEGAGVLLDRSFNRGSRITNDGVTVAKNIQPKGEFENLVATAFKEGASKTGEKVGDGTTSTIVISAKLINDALSKVSDTSVQITGLDSQNTGVNSLRKHIIAAVPKIKEAIKEKTKKIKTIKELEDVIDVSLAGNREVAKTLSEMIWKTGTEGFISLTDGFKGGLETEVIEGARFPMKIAAPVFLNHADRYEMVAEDIEVLVTNYKIDTLVDFASFWNTLNPGQMKVSKLIVFAPNFSDEVLIQMVKLIAPQPIPGGGTRPSGIQIFPIKCPSLGSEDLTPHNFQDLADFCDAKFIDKNKGDKLKDIKSFDLGFVEKCTVKSVEDREDAVLLGGRGAKGEKTKKRIADLKSRLELTKMPEHKALIQKRIASMASAGGLIRVGAATEAEALPLKHKIEDAVFAGQAALKYGYVKGGGLCLKEIANELFKDDLLIYDALCSPYNQIQENCGTELKIGKEIIDPARVVELEVEHGFGVAANIITIKAIVPEFDEHDPRMGYEVIANALDRYTLYWAKDKGMVKSGIDEGTAEALQKREAAMAKEND